MREWIKSVILLLLVLSSLYLTSRLVFGKPYLETASEPDIELLTFGELKPVDEHLFPELWLKTSEERWAQYVPWYTGYDNAWGITLSLLKPDHLPEKSDPPEYLPGKRVEMIFPAPVYSALWLPSSQIRSLAIQTVVWREADFESVWFQDNNGQWWRSDNVDLPFQWVTRLETAFLRAKPFRLASEESMAGLQASERGVLLPSVLPMMSAYTVSIEPLVFDLSVFNKLLHSMFVNMAMVRRIEERDGAVIYTDGQRGLRVFPSGEMELTVPDNEPGGRKLEITEILRETAQYLHLMGGWPDSLFVQSIHESEKPQWFVHEITFGNIQFGYPLISGTPPVRISFSDRGIIKYNRQIRQLINSSGDAFTLVPPETAIASVSENLQRPVNQMRFSAVYPIYYIDDNTNPQSLARPAWLVCFENQQQAVVDGLSGEFLAWLN